MTTATLYVLVFFAGLFLILLVYWLKLMVSSRKHKQRSFAENSYLIVYASQSGQTEAYAQQTAQQLQQMHISVTCCDIAQITLQDLFSAKKILWMVSTYGEGDAPDSAQSFSQWFFKLNDDLSHLSFAILGFGDRAYSQFCGFAVRLQQHCIRLNAQPYFDLVQVDRNSLEDLGQWQLHLSKVIGQNVNIHHQMKEWHEVQLKNRVLLNPGSQGTGLYHLKLHAPQSLTWQSGDIVEIQCINTVQELEHFQTLYPQLNSGQLLQLRDKNLRKIPDLNICDNLDEWIAQFETLALREYSIASIPSQGQIELIVRQEVNENGLGLGSGLLTESLTLDSSLPIHIRSHSAFHLVQENVPMIFIGNGSGLAGLWGHLQQRLAWNQHENWLIYGERQEEYDAIFSTQIQQWKESGHLTELDLVYSRDQKALKYVQDVLIARQSELQTWIERGAVIYVCGSLQGMAKGVDEALQQVIGEVSYQTLKNQKRYLRDVY